MFESQRRNLKTLERVLRSEFVSSCFCKGSETCCECALHRSSVQAAVGSDTNISGLRRVLDNMLPHSGPGYSSHPRKVYGL